MSSTKPINIPPQGGGSNGKKKAAAFAAAGAAVVGGGAAAAAYLADDQEPVEPVIITDDPDIVDPEKPANDQPEIPGGSTSGGASGATANTPHQNSSHNSSSTTSGGAEPQPITDNGGGSSTIVDPVADPVAEPIADIEVEEPVITEPADIQIDPEPTVEITQDTPAEDIVNPDEIAEAIISEEQIDNNDIDMADVVNFDEIGTVYTVDGESYTAAAFHDGAGNNLIMVDVDGDNVFDLITDYEGNVLADVPGNLSVGDAVENIEEDEVYLAYDPDTDNVDEFGADTLSDDLLTT